MYRKKGIIKEMKSRAYPRRIYESFFISYDQGFGDRFIRINRVLGVVSTKNKGNIRKLNVGAYLLLYEIR
jgi:hypothetical protein